MKKLFSIALGLILIGIAATALVIASVKIPVIHALYYKYSSHPNSLVDEFLVALNNDDLSFAKEMVVPGLRVRIDQWKTAAGHEATPCQRDDLIEPYAGGTGLGGPDSNGNKALFISESYTCYNGNRASIAIEGVTLVHDRGGWIITDWDKICISSSSEPETCY